ncbi:NADPH:quinone reductase-like Zn-dependent oxidoreductase [Paenibacillus taihuensis]|uniref:NADPH:quinone reductase-like Zn-dependent oxidoreductase n=1 Tax=Paenibacillus taihuensis TaxID=1156355 RepID=A0A3D9SLX6_9BACL|nr:zinc-dependent alcohol dehydrogenase family protein [Paenibacillus taihuensis]REE91599.1 NADPH:quinone reductase-like Zn-dependent oxidoreductase [Paenibacillus taihuensis]
MSEATMKAAILEQFKAPFTIRETPRPTPQKGEVLVRIKASGVNPLDLKTKEGVAAHTKTTTPAILGIDMAGVVEEVGADVTDFKPGDAVYGMTGGVGGVQGSLAEYAAVDAALLAKMPESMSMRDAAALPLIAITAWEALIDQAKIQSGQTVLIHGGAGGVGHIAIQLAKQRGANVFATGSGASQTVIKNLGATPIDYTDTSVDDYVQKHTGGEGFDVVLDTVGGATLDDSFRAVKKYTGHAVSILGWGTHSLAPLSFRAGTYSGVFTLMPLLTGEGRAHHGEILREIAALYSQGLLKPILNQRIFTLDEIEDAHRSMGEKQVGKVVVNIE